MNNVVIVESPAKADTIKRYLGKGYEVLASYGHVRDLKPKEGSVRPDEDFALSWSIVPRATQRLENIARAIKGADRLLLATDPDREGEAIAWHLLETLSAKKGVLDGVEVARIAFNAITKEAVGEAIRKPRRVDPDLVDAYLARRALDYLVGFNLSPVLWRKLPGSRSAGRVQSVALRLICERENERESFNPQEYWTIIAQLSSESAKISTALAELHGEKIEKFTIQNAKDANKARQAIEALSWKVQKIETKQIKRRPAPPFTTSTLTQEAIRKLGMTAKETMRLAQNLYEGKSDMGGLITYMRTDAVQVNPQSLNEIRNAIGKFFGETYLPPKPYLYKSKAKNAQEAHEAIRPTQLFRHPEQMKAQLSPQEHRLYALIWNRAMASQMEAATVERSAVSFADTADKKCILRATGQKILFDGFLKLYRESADAQKDEDAQTLPNLKEGQIFQTDKVEEQQHFTQAPPRYTEASLVRRMEEIGIGRPSTYAPILSLLRERDYVLMEKRQFVPHSRGRLVTAFLEEFFSKYINYDFTANMETSLDHISAGEEKWKDVLAEFWKLFNETVQEASQLRTSAILDKLNEILARYVFPPREPGKDPRDCPDCEKGQLSIKVGRFGAFVGCSRYPDCRHTRPLTIAENEGSLAGGARSLGKDPETGREIFVKSGRFGPYVERAAENDEKPKRAPLPKDKSPDDMELASAISLLALPRLVGKHPETDADVMAGVGRYGPYVSHQRVYASIGKDEDVLTIGLNRAIALLAEKKEKKPKRAPIGKMLGKHPDDDEPVLFIEKGRYGPYVKHGRTNAGIAQNPPENMTLEIALSLLAARTKKTAKVKTAKTPKKTARKKK